MKLRSYAKINLTLDIMGRREDGYHDVETLFQTVNLYDEVELAELPGDDILVSCNHKGLQGENNICYQAALIFKRLTGIKKGIYIKIHKRIPAGAGLSGGSSNAAAVLKGMACLFKLPVSHEELLSMAKELGSDVAFHLIGGTCVGRGRGEILVPLLPLPKHYLVIVYPGFPIITAEAYSGLSYDEIGLKKSTGMFVKDYDLQYIHNDFEYSVFGRYPQLRAIKELLGKNSALSGSGSCLFGIYRDEGEAKRHYKRIKTMYRHTFLAETINKTISYAEEMGICFGVKRAMEGALRADDGRGIYVLGSLVHNKEVMKELSQRGVRFVSQSSDVRDGTVIISAHGAPDSEVHEMRKRKVRVVDLTCPVIKKIHRLTKRKENDGRKIIIVGDKQHAEVKGIVGNLKNFRVIDGLEDLTDDDLKSKMLMVSQTTYEAERFISLREKMRGICPDIEFEDTVCAATRRRQESAVRLARQSDMVIVVGDRISANTRRLFEICSGICETRHIETEDELESHWSSDKEKIGITAGASTPDWIISSVEKKLRLML